MTNPDQNRIEISLLGTNRPGSYDRHPSSSSTGEPSDPDRPRGRALARRRRTSRISARNIDTAVQMLDLVTLKRTQGDEPQSVVSDDDSMSPETHTRLFAAPLNLDLTAATMRNHTGSLCIEPYRTSQRDVVPKNLQPRQEAHRKAGSLSMEPYRIPQREIVPKNLQPRQEAHRNALSISIAKQPNFISRVRRNVDRKPPVPPARLLKPKAQIKSGPPGQLRSLFNQSDPRRAKQSGWSAEKPAGIKILADKSQDEKSREGRKGQESRRVGVQVSNEQAGIQNFEEALSSVVLPEGSTEMEVDISGIMPDKSDNLIGVNTIGSSVAGFMSKAARLALGSPESATTPDDSTECLSIVGPPQQISQQTNIDRVARLKEVFETKSLSASSVIVGVSPASLDKTAVMGSSAIEASMQQTVVMNSSVSKPSRVVSSDEEKEPSAPQHGGLLESSIGSFSEKDATEEEFNVSLSSEVVSSDSSSRVAVKEVSSPPKGIPGGATDCNVNMTIRSVSTDFSNDLLIEPSSPQDKISFEEMKPFVGSSSCQSNDFTPPTFTETSAGQLETASEQNVSNDHRPADSVLDVSQNIVLEISSRVTPRHLQGSPGFPEGSSVFQLFDVPQSPGHELYYDCKDDHEIQLKSAPKRIPASMSAHVPRSYPDTSRSLPKFEKNGGMNVVPAKPQSKNVVPVKPQSKVASVTSQRLQLKGSSQAKKNDKLKICAKAKVPARKPPLHVTQESSPNTTPVTFKEKVANDNAQNSPENDPNEIPRNIAPLSKVSSRPTVHAKAKAKSHSPKRKARQPERGKESKVSEQVHSVRRNNLFNLRHLSATTPKPQQEFVLVENKSDNSNALVLGKSSTTYSHRNPASSEPTSKGMIGMFETKVKPGTDGQEVSLCPREQDSHIKKDRYSELESIVFSPREIESVTQQIQNQELRHSQQNNNNRALLVSPGMLVEVEGVQANAANVDALECDSLDDSITSEGSNPEVPELSVQKFDGAGLRALRGFRACAAFSMNPKKSSSRVRSNVAVSIHKKTDKLEVLPSQTVMSEFFSSNVNGTDRVRLSTLASTTDSPTEYGDKPISYVRGSKKTATDVISIGIPKTGHSMEKGIVMDRNAVESVATDVSRGPIVPGRFMDLNSDDDDLLMSVDSKTTKNVKSQLSDYNTRKNIKEGFMDLYSDEDSFLVSDDVKKKKDAAALEALRVCIDSSVKVNFMEPKDDLIRTIDTLYDSDDVSQPSRNSQSGKGDDQGSSEDFEDADNFESDSDLPIVKPHSTASIVKENIMDRDIDNDDLSMQDISKNEIDAGALRPDYRSTTPLVIPLDQNSEDGDEFGSDIDTEIGKDSLASPDAGAEIRGSLIDLNSCNVDLVETFQAELAVIEFPPCRTRTHIKESFLDLDSDDAIFQEVEMQKDATKSTFKSLNKTCPSKAAFFDLCSDDDLFLPSPIKMIPKSSAKTTNTSGGITSDDRMIEKDKKNPNLSIQHRVVIDLEEPARKGKKQPYTVVPASHNTNTSNQSIWDMNPRMEKLSRNQNIEDTVDQKVDAMKHTTNRCKSSKDIYSLGDTRVQITDIQPVGKAVPRSVQSIHIDANSERVKEVPSADVWNLPKQEEHIPVSSRAGNKRERKIRSMNVVVSQNDSVQRDIPNRFEAIESRKPILRSYGNRQRTVKGSINQLEESPKESSYSEESDDRFSKSNESQTGADPTSVSGNKSSLLDRMGESCIHDRGLRGKMRPDRSSFRHGTSRHMQGIPATQLSGPQRAGLALTNVFPHNLHDYIRFSNESPRFGFSPRVSLQDSVEKWSETDCDRESEESTDPLFVHHRREMEDRIMCPDP